MEDVLNEPFKLNHLAATNWTHPWPILVCTGLRTLTWNYMVSHHGHTLIDIFLCQWNFYNLIVKWLNLTIQIYKRINPLIDKPSMS